MTLTTRQRNRRLRFIATASVSNECHIWPGAVDEATGYGKYRTETENLWAHRMVYELLVGPIPDGHHVHHSCEERRCVNPNHLDVMTPSEHWRIGNSPSARRARATHCWRGHLLAGDNLKVDKHGHRACRVCLRLKANRRALRLREARA